MLILPELLLLIALHDEKGTILSPAATSINYGLAGAVIMELALRKKVELRDKKITVVDDSSTGDSVLDQALYNMKSQGKSKKPGYWVNKLSGQMTIKDFMTDRLVEKGIIRVEEHKILWIFDSPRYPMKDPLEEREIREQIRKIVLHGDSAEPRTAVLIGLVNACRLTNEIFSKEERKEAQIRIKEIIKKDILSKAVADTVAAIEAAVMVAIFSAAAASPTNS
ncbi:GOLPH3/VPS74 family protein [Candidatus Formimonas warabiya]|uniref:GPP34 family phosphoprotein n=1 Tax=Formimonas warabiya TaxID=1761012 RepID=A0A3G1KZU8_FORW1|nr:GPP34 family phosphoprotein [Candidatus Formimonas warabiya]ATW27940.1 hypothetical protein DCMF_27150 [Candidatus Formimonas warabiya]